MKRLIPVRGIKFLTMGNAEPRPSRLPGGHLSTGEEIILTFHPSMWGYAWHYLLGILLIAVGAFIPVPEGRIAVVLAGAFYLGYTETRRRRTTYSITNRRIVKERRIISRKSSTVLYPHITDLHLEQSFIGRLTNTGTLSINTAGKEGFELVMEKIPRPGMVKSEIESRMMEYSGTLP